MKRPLIFLLSLLGLIGAGYSAYLFSLPRKGQPPVFQPATNPYAQGIYAIGIVEADQSSGANTNLYADVTGVVSRVLVHEGERVHQGTPLLQLDDSVPRAQLAQQQQAAAAAQSQLAQLHAEPRPETLAVAQAQADVAYAAVRQAQIQFDKLREAQQINAGAVSRDSVDNARSSLEVARATAELADRQLALTRAGAWSYEIASQDAQFHALERAAAAAEAQLEKFVLRAPRDGMVLSIGVAAGSYLGAQGSYDTYTESYVPPVVMGSGGGGTLAVRCFVDEILLQRLPEAGKMRAEMAVRGSKQRIPLQFQRIQPYVSPKVELSNQRQERVDVRVLPVIFSFKPDAATRIFPGQQVDVYIAGGS